MRTVFLDVHRTIVQRYQEYVVDSQYGRSTSGSGPLFALAVQGFDFRGGEGAVVDTEFIEGALETEIIASTLPDGQRGRIRGCCCGGIRCGPNQHSVNIQAERGT